MAQFGIFLAFQDKQSGGLKGNSVVKGYEGWTLGHTMNVGGYSIRRDGAVGKNEKRVAAHVNEMNLTVGSGSANAEMYAALLATKKFDKVFIAQCLQPVDNSNTQVPDLIQEITLTNVYITAIADVWHGTPGAERSLNISLDYGQITFAIGKKTADFVVRNL